MRTTTGTNVIGGPGAFVIVAENFNSFGQAIVKKLIAEIAELPAAQAPQASPRRLTLVFAPNGPQA